jgi:tetratricopeptide (TPR) repeat protein
LRVATPPSSLGTRVRVVVVNMPQKDVDEAKAEANRLMQTGRREEAKAILETLIERNPPSEDLYEDVIYNYLLGEAYPEAKKLARRYEREFGAKPTPELSLENIEKEERKQRDALARYATGEAQVFRRLSLMERGNFPRYLPWSSWVWQEVRIAPDAIVLKKRLRTHRLRWSQIRRASLTKDEAYYAGNFSYVLKRVFLETTSGETYKIDVSTMAPEFENVTMLEQAIREHLTLEEGTLRKRNEANDWLGGFLVLLVIFLIAISLIYLAHIL